LARTAASLVSIVDVLGRGEQGPRMPDEARMAEEMIANLRPGVDYRILRSSISMVDNISHVT
jgi:hypothetical protein